MLSSLRLFYVKRKKTLRILLSGFLIASTLASEIVSASGLHFQISLITCCKLPNYPSFAPFKVHGTQVDIHIDSLHQEQGKLIQRILFS